MTPAAAVSQSAIDSDIERRIAQQLATLRAEHGWSLDRLAERTGISRATLSRLERSELSPTAAMLGTLCSVYGWTLSRLMAEAETRPPNSCPRRNNRHGPIRRPAIAAASSRRPRRDCAVSWSKEHIPAGATVSFATAPIAGLEHHLWMLEGALTLEVDGVTFRLRTGDCLRYVLTGPTRFQSTGKRGARYLIAMVRP